MGKNPSPGAEELEFVYERMARGLGGLDIQEEMQDTEFPARSDARYFRQRKRELDAARKVLESSIAIEHDPLVIEKRREHEGTLVVALEALRRDPDKRMNPLYVWETMGPEPVEMSYWHGHLEIPDDLGVRCLFEHLSPDDDMLVAYRESAELFRKGVELTTQFHWLLVDRLRATGLPLRDEPTQTITGIGPQFMFTSTDIALGTPEWRAGEAKYERPPIPNSVGPRFKLLFNGLIVAVGNAGQLDTLEAIHRDVRSSFEPDLAMNFRDKLERYAALAHRLDRLIDIRVQL